MRLLLLVPLLVACEQNSTDTAKPVDTTPLDQDGDGTPDDADCAPEDASVSPTATELCDGIDNNCDGDVDEGVQATFYADADGDTYGDRDAPVEDCAAPTGYVTDATDCDDSLATVNPGATESCDDLDDDCDGDIDEGVLSTFYVDADADGYGNDAYPLDACELPYGYATIGGDCDDGDDAWHPGATEADCTDPNDYNCDGSVGYADADGDGWPACEDCDDGSDTVSPGMLEVCDALDVDEDCDGTADDADASAVGQSTTWVDADGDGYGDADSVIVACDPPADAVGDHSDCDDGALGIHPGAAETCDGVDEDCDGVVDDGVTFVIYVDADGDGYGNEAYPQDSCDVPEGFTTTGGDCDDGDPAFHPDAPEEDCTDPADYNCDGVVGFVDADGDGWAACADCDDAAAAVNADATELCDGIDNDCDGLRDGDDPDVADETLVHPDTDHDGYGDQDVDVWMCGVSEGYTEDGSDCDDSTAAVSPGAFEACDTVDNDCDGTIDDFATDAVTWYYDYDGDGHGGTALTYSGCSAPSGYLTTGDDCDDGDADRYPGNAEVCDALDNDCDGLVDDGVAPDWYEDTDGDGFGVTSEVRHDCVRPYGYVPDPADCDDGDATIFPTQTEVCNDIDDNCDTLVDDADPALDTSTGSPWHPDVDGDSYGSATAETWACLAPSGMIADDSDCDDASADVRPGVTDECDTVDTDCDGTIDEDGWQTIYIDVDGDAYGDSEDAGSLGCLTDGYADNDDDCDDLDATVQSCFTSFDGTTGSSWSAVTNIPTSGYSLAAYVPLTDTYQTYAYYTTHPYGYDASTNTWHTYTSTNPLSGSLWAASAPYDGKQWWIRSGTVRSWDPEADTWTSVASVTQTESYAMTETDEDGNIYGYSYTGTLIIYNTAGNSTSYVSTGKGSCYETRMGYDPTTRALFFGGFGSSALYKYAIDTGTVSTVTSIPESQLNDIFCSDRSGHIYAAGGSSGKTIYQYTTATDTWAKIPDFPIDHGNNGACTVSEDGYLYVTPGSTSQIYRIELY